MRTCPFCGGIAYAEEVDIGVGWQQVAPAECTNAECGAMQDGDGRWLSPEEVSRAMEEFAAAHPQDTKRPEPNEGKLP